MIMVMIKIAIAMMMMMMMIMTTRAKYKTSFCLWLSSFILKCWQALKHLLCIWIYEFSTIHKHLKRIWPDISYNMRVILSINTACFVSTNVVENTTDVYISYFFLYTTPDALNVIVFVTISAPVTAINPRQATLAGWSWLHSLDWWPK